MSWNRDDRDYSPSPDPAAAAERYYAEQDAHEPPEDDCCPKCGDRGWYQKEPDPGCDTCNGDGIRFWHTPDCFSEHCALNGDLDSCAGEVQPCPCSVVECAPCSERETAQRTAAAEAFLLPDEDPEVPF